MTDKRLEWFPLYYERFLLATMEWTTVEIGAYFLLLCHQWDKGFIPEDLNEVRKITRTHYRTPLERVLNKFAKVPQGLANETLLLIRIKQDNKSRTNTESGSKGGKSRARNEANARESLKNIEQNRIRTEQSESTPAPLNTFVDHKNNSGGTPEMPQSPHTGAHWERLRDSPMQLEAFAMGARKAGMFPATMTAKECIDGLLKIAHDFQQEFNRVCPEGNYKIFGYKLDDHIKKLASNPDAKPWEKPTTTQLNYTLPPNPHAK